MRQAIIVYGSKRGMTASMASVITEELEKHGVRVISKDVFEAKPDELNDYKYIILGCSTWSDGDLAADFIDFEREMDDLDLRGHYCAVFGPGSTRFRFFCEAVNILEAKLRSLGGRMMLPSLKVNEMAGDSEEESRAWAEVLAGEIGQID
jgi:flavodoxin I